MEKSILGLRTVIYKVDDIDKAKAWYALAFETKPYFDEPFYVGFEIGGYELGLLPEESPASGKTDHMITYWGVDDAGAAVRRFIALGASEHEAPRNVGGEIVTASVRDPWGNVIGLIYNPGFQLT